MAKGIQPFESSSDLNPRQSSNSTAASSYEHNNNNHREQPNMNSFSRRSRLNLPLNQMAIPIYTAPVSREEVEVGGQVLFQNFIHEEFQHQHIPDDALQAGDPPLESFPGINATRLRNPVSLDRPVSPAYASTPEGFKTIDFIKVGENLREIANQFAASRERPLIKRQADQVDLGHINKDSFFNLLEAIFRHGINKHCIVALFFFCSDVLIRCFKEKMNHLGTQLFMWSLQFIVDRVCQWVYEHGGWEKVFSDIWKVLIRVTTVSALLVIIGCGVLYMKKNW